nr:hypothetical protein [Spirochaetaceae bacterium]
HKELQRILDSPIFLRTTHSGNILRYLLNIYLRNPSMDVKEYTLGVDVLGKDNDYDPQTETSVRVEMNRLRSRLKKYYQNASENCSLFFDIPRGKYRLCIIENSPESRISPELSSLEINREPIKMGILFNRIQETHSSENWDYFCYNLVETLRTNSLWELVYLPGSGAVDPSIQLQPGSILQDPPDYHLQVDLFTPVGQQVAFLSLIDRQKGEVLLSTRINLSSSSLEDMDRISLGFQRKITEQLHSYSQFQ